MRQLLLLMRFTRKIVSHPVVLFTRGAVGLHKQEMEMRTAFGLFGSLDREKVPYTF
jgi:hypothetical protein